MPDATRITLLPQTPRALSRGFAPACSCRASAACLARDLNALIALFIRARSAPSFNACRCALTPLRA